MSSRRSNYYYRLPFLALTAFTKFTHLQPLGREWQMHVQCNVMPIDTLPCKSFNAMTFAILNRVVKLYTAKVYRTLSISLMIYHYSLSNVDTRMAIIITKYAYSHHSPHLLYVHNKLQCVSYTPLRVNCSYFARHVHFQEIYLFHFYQNTRSINIYSVGNDG